MSLYLPTLEVNQAAVRPRNAAPASRAGLSSQSLTASRLLSPEYLSSVYGTAEWQAAWRDDPLGEQHKLIPLRVADCDRPGLLGSIVSEDLFGLTEAQTRSTLRRIVDQAVTGRGKPAQQPPFPGPGRIRAIEVPPPFPGALPQIWNIPARNPNFTGRGDLLNRLHRLLAGAGPVAVHSLHGMAGSAKPNWASSTPTGTPRTTNWPGGCRPSNPG